MFFVNLNFKIFDPSLILFLICLTYEFILINSSYVDTSFDTPRSPFGSSLIPIVQRKYGINSGLNPAASDNQLFINQISNARSRKPCKRITNIRNGLVKSRNRGRILQFACFQGFNLIGESEAYCNNGNWNEPPPVCVKGGCRKLAIPINGSLRLIFGDGVAIFGCHYGYDLEGDRVLICDGTRWNSTTPQCLEIPPIELTTTRTTTINTIETSTAFVPTTLASFISTSPIFKNTSKKTYTTTEETVSLELSTFKEISTENINFEMTTSTPKIEKSTNSEFIERNNSLQTSTESNVDDHVTISNSLEHKDEFLYETTTIRKDNFKKSTKVFSVATEASTIKHIVEHGVISTEAAIIAKNSSIDKNITQENGTEREILDFEEASSTSTYDDDSSEEILNITKISVSGPQIDFFEKEAEIEHAVVLENPLSAPNPTKIFTPNNSTTTKTTSEPTTPKNIIIEKDAKSLGFDEVAQETNDEIKKLEENENRIREKIAISPSKQDSAFYGDEGRKYDFAHVLIIVGTVLIVIGVISIIVSIMITYWRRNKGIARRRNGDLDGRILSFHEGSDEIVWYNPNENMLTNRN